MPRHATASSPARFAATRIVATLFGMLGLTLLAACAGTNPVSTTDTTAGDPAKGTLSAPPSTMMTPHGY